VFRIIPVAGFGSQGANYSLIHRVTFKSSGLPGLYKDFPDFALFMNTMVSSQLRADLVYL